jgi:hypothetical protein
MSASFVRFLVRCTVIVAASTVLVLALMQTGTAGESAGACASSSDHYAQVNWLQSAVRPLAALAHFCD